MRKFYTSFFSAAAFITMSVAPAAAESSIGTYNLPVWQMTGNGGQSGGFDANGTSATGPNNNGNGSIAGPVGDYTNGPQSPTVGMSAAASADGRYSGPTAADGGGAFGDDGDGVSVGDDGADGSDPGIGDPGNNDGFNE